MALISSIYGTNKILRKSWSRKGKRKKKIEKHIELLKQSYKNSIKK